MKLRVVGGTLKGRLVDIPRGRDLFRPSSRRVRAGVADALCSRLIGAVAADICAGSGIFGFEMISRGAERVVFVDKDRFRCRIIEEHAERFGVKNMCQIVCKDMEDFTDCCKDRFDIIFCDPPYDDPEVSSKIPSLMRILAEGGILVYERRRIKGNRNDQYPGLMPQPFERKIYGDAEVCFFSVS